MTTCPMVGCGCPLQRTVDGTLRDGVVAHLARVHFGHYSDSMAKAESFLRPLERADDSVERVLGGDQV